MDTLFPAALPGFVVGLILALTGAGGGILAVAALVACGVIASPLFFRVCAS